MNVNTVASDNTNSRFLDMCRRFGISINTPLRGGDICMQVEDCNTGSVPRKVISHLFGRNKVCTRRIPERAWVCMCRKHYQRLRYRKGAEFSMTQMDMVYEQVVRMMFWSRGMENEGSVNVEKSYIRSWAFSIRKRELRRLVEMNGQDPLPRWIIQSLGAGKTHNDILDIVERLHQEIQQGVLKDVPPVEFLPDVVDIQGQPTAQSPIRPSADASDDMEWDEEASSVRFGRFEDGQESPFTFIKDSSPLETVEEERLEPRSNSEATVSSTDSGRRAPVSILFGTPGTGQHQQNNSLTGSPASPRGTLSQIPLGAPFVHADRRNSSSTLNGQLTQGPFSSSVNRHDTSSLICSTNLLANARSRMPL